MVTLRLEDSRILLTGASGGIGNAIARALHARGASLVLTARRTELLDRLCDELGGSVEAISADLCDEAGVSRVPAEAGVVDALVANAGLPGTGRLESFSAAQLDRVIDLNLRSPMQLALSLLPGMLERRSGHIVLISSLSGKIATPTSSVYCATKFGLRGFGLALHEELRGSGVGVTTIYPGFIREAGMFVDSGARLPPGLGTSSPREVADAVIKGIERNRAEIDVAPLTMRSGARIFTAAPSIGAAVSRALGGGKIAASVAKGQRENR
jgi:short-subunit dehydrogenase